ncbi:unnamed protein product, partial [marine sediment metagenome]
MKEELKDELEEVKDYIKTRDKVMKESIKQIDEKVECYLGPIETEKKTMEIPKNLHSSNGEKW